MGLKNNHFNKLIESITEDNVVTLLYIDIDYFKRINDLYGHQNGDIVLEELGKILLNSCSHTDIVSRNGGEEFSILMTDCPEEKVMEVAERIRKAV
jgi:diguanylate cyclase